MSPPLNRLTLRVGFALLVAAAVRRSVRRVIERRARRRRDPPQDRRVDGGLRGRTHVARRRRRVRPGVLADPERRLAADGVHLRGGRPREETEETSATAQEIASSAQQLAGAATELEQLVGRFTISA